MIRLKNILKETIENNKVICDNCGWSWNISDGGKDTYICHKCGCNNTPLKNEDSGNETITFEEFASKRLEGATKIANDAKEKGGPALLTYNHFQVKLPYYKNASKGNFDVDKSKDLLDKKSKEFCEKIYSMSLSEIEFQKLVGEIEVLGELLLYKK
jgi:tRNA(Ile2) C34 agmatinyltransferase TiaS